MKIWNGYGSEHSANLVMIGSFEDAATAEEAKVIIDQLTKEVTEEVQAGLLKVGDRSDHFTEGLLALVRKLDVFSLSSVEMEQFAYDVSVRVEGNKVILKTDEIDVSAFMKIMFDKGAKIEVYSAHIYKKDAPAAQE